MRAQPYDYLTSRAKSDPEGFLYIGPDRKVSNSSALEFTQQLATYFQNIGVRRGDVVALNLPASLHILFMLASWHENCISSVFGEAIANQKVLKPDWLFSSQKYPESAATNVVLVDESVINKIESLTPSRACLPYESEEDICRVLFSSGTTGTPKGVPISLKENQLRALRRNKTKISGTNQMTLFDFGSIGGYGTFFNQYICGESYILPGVAPTNLKQIFSNNVRYLSSSINRIIELLDYIEFNNLEVPEIEKVSIGGASASPELMKRIKRILGAETFNIYASTEAGFIAYRNWESSNPFEMGKIFDDLILEIVDTEDNKVATDEIGVIRIKSPDQSKGYFRDLESTEKYFKNGWFYIGDFGRINPDGLLFLEGRMSEVINFGGIKIDPAKLDHFIVGKCMVEDAGSFSFYDAQGIERLGLAVVSKSAIDKNVILNEITSQFGVARPNEVYQVEIIPRNSQGKVERLKLRELLTSGQ